MPRRRRRRRRRILLAFALGALGIVPIAATLTPRWYAAERRRRADAQSVRDDVRDSAQAFSDALLGSARFDVHLRQRQVNDWITLRGEIYPALDRALPADWQHPAVSFRPGSIRVAATYAGGPLRVVVAIDLAVTLDADDIILQLSGLSCGWLPVPSRAVRTALARPVQLAPGKAWRGSPAIVGDLVTGLRIGRRAVWPNGDRAYLVEAIAPQAGTLEFSIQPLGSIHGSGRSNHASPRSPP